MIEALAFMAAAQAPSFIYHPNCESGSQHELTICASKEFEQADKAMNEQWQKTEALMKRLDAYYQPNPALGQSSYAVALLKGQRAWLQFREAFCPIFGAGGGSMGPMFRYKCLRDVTKARTEQLKSLMLSPATGNPYFEDL